MQRMRFGRKRYSLVEGKPVLRSTSITVRTRPGEDEETFTKRILGLYGQVAGTVEMVFKRGLPDYAVVTFAEQDFEADPGSDVVNDDS